MKTPRNTTARFILTILISALGVVLAGAWMEGCRGASGHGDSDEIVVWVSGDTRGYLEPCGCRVDQAGGLPARMTLLTQDKSSNHLLLDVGNLTSGGRSYELLKLDFLMRGMATMGYDAVNLGKREVNLDRDTLLSKIQSGHLPFVSCNVLDAQTNTPLTSPTLVKTVGGTRVGITGVVQAESEDVGPGLRVRPPEEALAEVLPSLRGQCDFVVVLAFVPTETLHNLANRFHEIGALFGGDVPQSSSQAESVNRATLFSVTDRGKVLGRLTFRRGGDNSLTLTSSHAYKTADTIAPAPTMTALLKEYKDSLRERNIELAAAEGLDPINAQTSTADTYAGQDKCRSCHAEAHRVTLASAHALAYETLEKKSSEYDPECLRCHTVGYGARDGFINLQKTPRLAGVQCENCHGRGTAHIQAVEAGKHGQAAINTFRAVTPNSCIRCHDEENSAHFDYATYWPKIKHGKQ